MFDAVARVASDEAAGETARPAIFVVEPREHPCRGGFARARLDRGDEFFAEVFGGETGARVHVESAEAHRFKLVDLTQELRDVEPGVPCPERRGAVLGGGVSEQREVDAR